MILQAKNISKTFQYPQKIAVLTDISLSVERGETLAIMGRSGEGKTTLLHILGLLEAPDSGAVTVANDAASTGDLLRNRHIGFIFQSFNLLEDFTALDNVLMPARIARRPIDLEYGRHLLDQVDLLNRAHFPAKLLSGGEKQRVAIARALCNDPDLILADEPSGNLDRASADAVGSLLFSLVRQKNKSLILVTHNPDLASLCERRYRLSGGHLLQATE